MKKYILILGLCLFAQAQEKYSFQGVVQVDSVSADELFNRAKAWFDKTYISSQKVINTADKAIGTISASPLVSYNSKRISFTKLCGVIRYNINIYLKDGRYKYTIDDFYHDADISLGLITTDTICNESQHSVFMGKNLCKSALKEIKETIDMNIIPLKKSLIEFMSKKTEPQNDNW